ncbi:uncharacterized protein BJ212DRAFT_1230180, partial [Suillus subaureus]
IGLIATSINVEQVFSCGCLLLSHVRSCLLAQSTQAFLCLGSWSTLNLVKPEDIHKVTILPDVEGEEQELEHGWDRI